MARTVAFTQHGEPRWLTLGLRWLELVPSLGVDRAARELGLEPHQARTAHRYGRAARFVLAMREELRTAVPVLAGSVAVLELSKLHSLNPQRALLMAEKVLSGELDTAQVRAQFAQAREQVGATGPGPSRANSRTSFRNLVVQRLTMEQILRKIGRVGKITWTDTPGALQADLTVTFGNPWREMAVAVRAPHDNAAKSSATVAAELLSHVATLLLRYESALLVLPFDAQHRAEATVQLWETWANPERQKSNNMYVLLLGQTEHKWLRPDEDAPAAVASEAP